MAFFPIRINNNNTMVTDKSLSPRQIANKMYTLAIKKLDKDNRRSKPQYSVRERLLLTNTIIVAEEFLRKPVNRLNRRVLAFEDDQNDSQPISNHKPLLIHQSNTMNERKNEKLTVEEYRLLSKNEQPQQQQWVAVHCYRAVVAFNNNTCDSLSTTEEVCKPMTNMSILIPPHSLTIM
ncbi:uncharacterized protein BX663DRAFT_493535 [Cokeromyces recurvatus]|uniref:uncharacterized protein n=1 Tax=Cokeromyces recurvatus TaxID=90255 RepID=UPI00221FCE86|nr:uncharacterized protein BX663DRAFT_493535 [Cokeromyces recurvatus]KAI7908256.1 hypothetical protein BX663DRAFT_493535 [Cokeromyces recurvatus]